MNWGVSDMVLPHKQDSRDTQVEVKDSCNGLRESINIPNISKWYNRYNPQPNH
jgi:hypothetical protein